MVSKRFDRPAQEQARENPNRLPQSGWSAINRRVVSPEEDYILLIIFVFLTFTTLQRRIYRPRLPGLRRRKFVDRVGGRELGKQARCGVQDLMLDSTGSLTGEANNERQQAN